MKGILKKNKNEWTVKENGRNKTYFLCTKNIEQLEKQETMDNKVEFDLVDEIVDLGRHGSTVILRAKLKNL